MCLIFVINKTFVINIEANLRDPKNVLIFTVRLLINCIFFVNSVYKSHCSDIIMLI